MYKDLDTDANWIQLYDTVRLEVPAGGVRYRPVQIANAVDHSLWVALLAPKDVLVDAVRDLIGGKTLSLGVLPDVVNASRVLEPLDFGSGADPPSPTSSCRRRSTRPTGSPVTGSSTRSSTGTSSTPRA